MDPSPEDRKRDHGNCVILDVNALMAPFQTGINLDLELAETLPGYEPVVPSSVIRELEMLVRNSNDWKLKAALKLANNYRIIDIKGRGDSPIFNLSVNRRWPVATMDRNLRKKILSRGIPVVFVRGRGHMELVEP